MLGPDDRAILLDHLRAPAGYTMAAGVATTFTLNFATALVAPIAFGAHEARTETDPISVLESVRSTLDRLDIFYQGGQVMIPRSVPSLVAMLEPMIHPVQRPRPGYIFHPKIWCLRYTADGMPDQFRLLVSSRNIHDSAAWDVIVRLDGTMGDGVEDRNAPIAALLRQLPEWAIQPLPSARRARINSLANDIERVRWHIDDETVEDFRFHALGVPGFDARPDFHGISHLIISPFLNDAGLTTIAEGTKNVAVVSEPEALDALDDEWRQTLGTTASRRSFVMAPDLVRLPELEEEAEDVEQVEPSRFDDEHSGLHAKVIVVDRWLGPYRFSSHVFAGSVNATSAALGGNVEFMIELEGKKHHLGVEQFLADDAAFRSLIQRYEPAEERQTPPDDDALRALENMLRGWAEVPLVITMEPMGETYTLRVTSERDITVPDGHTLELSLLSHAGPKHLHAGGPIDWTIDRVPLEDISPFIAFRVTDPDGITAGSVMQGSLIGDDLQNRLDAILIRQIDTREKFLRYLYLLLGFTDAFEMLTEQGSGDTGRWAAALASGHGLLELVMNALANRHESLRDLDALVRKIQASDDRRHVLPEGFAELWEQAGKTARALKRAGA